MSIEFQDISLSQEMQPFIEEPHLVVSNQVMLRPLIKEDFARISDAVRASLKNLRMWLPWVAELPDENDHYGITISYYKEAESRTAYHYPAFKNENFLGIVSLYQISLANGSAILGYWCRSDVDSPLAFIEAIKSVIQLAFDKYGLQNLVIPVVFGNYVSELAAKQLNFKLQSIETDSGSPIKRFTLANQDFVRDSDTRFSYL